MHFLTAFKSSNTVRVTIPRRARNELGLLVGDTLKLETIKRGVSKNTNVAYVEREKAKRKKK